MGDKRKKRRVTMGDNPSMRALAKIAENQGVSISTLIAKWRFSFDKSDFSETPYMYALRKQAENEGLAIASFNAIVPSKSSKSKARVKRKAATPNHAPRRKRIIRENPLETAIESIEAKRALAYWQAQLFAAMGEKIPKAKTLPLDKRPASSLFDIAQNRPKGLRAKLIKLEENTPFFGI